VDLLTLRLLLRRQIKDPPSGGDWQEPELDALLNAGLLQIQRLIKQAVPHAFISTDTIDLISGTSLYALSLLSPAPWWIYSIRKLDSSSGSYAKIDKKPYSYLQSYTDTDETTTIWARIGRNIAIAPTPTTSQTAGLEVVYEPLLTMTLDADIPAIHDGLHMAIVLWAKILASEESDEQMDATRKTLAEMLVDISSYYPHEGDPDSMSPQIFKTDYRSA
jgi:hypothetical protein